MTITILDDVIAPNSLWSATVRGRVMRRNRRAENAGGFKQINVQWENSLRSWEFGTVPLSLSTWKNLQALYEVTDAGASGFLLFDPQDCVVTVENGVAIDYDSSDDTYRLIQRITAPGGTRTKDRIIRRPDVGSFRLFIDGVEELTYTLDDQTGIITIPSDPLAASVTWSGKIYVPVHFADDAIDWDLVVAGNVEARMFMGPRVMLEEVREE